MATQSNVEKEVVETRPLPLPPAPPFIADNDLDRPWSSINLLFADYLRATNQNAKKAALRVYGIYILLACQVVLKGLKALSSQPQHERSLCFRLMKQVAEAGKWLKSNPIVEENFRWGPGTSVLELAVGNATHFQKAIEDEGRWHSSATAEGIEKVQQCEAVWYNICQALDSMDKSAEKPIKPKDAHQRLKHIGSILQKKQGAVSKALIQIPKQGEEDTPAIFTGAPGNRQKKRHVESSGLTHAQIMEKNQMSHEPDCLIWYDKGPIISRREGLLRPPCEFSPAEMVALIDGSWITDRLIDCYLALVCHLGNGHLQLDEDSTMHEQEDSPNWHSWTTWLAKGLEAKKSLTRHWPPTAYPGAKIENVGHHFFPIHVMDNHWVMAVLSTNQGARTVDYYSSREGYESEFLEKWLLIADHLFNLSAGEVDVRDGSYRKPPQPRQRNDSDCGPFILCTARWLVESWPLNTLLPEDIRTLRRCMAGQLEKWSFT